MITYKAPKAIYMAKDFPRTKNGKILRRSITPGIATARSSR
jgi:acyl-coenzyme A synthetase/AMP-(fatty) acid ligase